MKRITLLFLILFLAKVGFSQLNVLTEAPQNNASTTAFRAPNGSSAYAYMRACALVLQSDLTAIAPGTTLTSFGFTLSTGAAVAVAGNFTLYLQNTSDATYLKGTNFPTAISTMTQVYASVMTIPQAVGTASILLTLSTPITYTGGGLYVAYDWYSPGPYSATNAIYLADNGAFLNPGCASGGSATTPPVTLGTTSFRPSFLFGYANPFTNDVQVVGLDVPGRLPLLLSSTHSIVSVIRNSGSQSQSNITVSLNVSGVNPVSTTQTIPSLAAGAITSVTFGPYTPLLPGANSISVTVASDQNNSNNLFTYSQSVTCNSYAQNPASGSFTGNNAGLGVNAGLIVSRLVNPVTSTLSNINMAFSNNAATVGNSIYGVLLNSSGSILATTNTITVIAAQLATIQSFTFAAGQALTAGSTYYYGFAQPANVNQYYPAGTFVSPYITPAVYYTVPITGGALTSVQVNSGYPWLDAIFTPSMSVSFSPTITCSGAPVILSVSGPNSYTWSQGVNQVGTNQSVTVSPLVNTTYNMTGTSTLGCNYSAGINLTVNPLPVVAITSSANTICSGSAITFTASGAVSYSLNGAATPSTISQSPLANTAYIVSGIDGNGCIGTASLDVTVNTLTVTVSSNTAVCMGKSANLSASGAGTYNYNWLIGSGFPFQTTNVTPSVSTVYTVVASEALSGCSQSGTVQVTVNPNPTVTVASSSSVICKGASAVLTASGADTYAWVTNSTNASISVTPQITTTYTLTGTNASGCTHTASILQTVSPCTGINEQIASQTISVYPNPNSGEFNLKLENWEKKPQVKIYNSVGKLVREFEVSSEITSIDLHDEAVGIYFLQLTDQKSDGSIYKIIKQ